MRLLHALAGTGFAILLASCTGSSGSAAASAHSHASGGQSVAEAAGDDATNPVPADPASVQAGRPLYAKNCQSCHGPRGKGDGPAVGRLNVEVPDLTDPDVQSQPDGTLFNTITKGSKPMPAYRKQLTEEQRWHVVNYLRSAFGNAGTR